MSVIEGQALAWLKISVLAAAIVAVIWVASKVFVAFYERKHGPAGGDDPD